MSPPILASTALGRLRVQAMPRRVLSIVSAIADEHGVNLYDLLSDSRQLKLSAARLAAYVAVQRMIYGAGNPSLPLMGQWFGRHHSSILKGIQRTQARTYKEHPRSSTGVWLDSHYEAA